MWQNKRSFQQEILDLGSDHYTEKEYKKCLTLLDRINFFLGGFRANRKALKKNRKINTILEVGCGKGSNCLFLHRLFPKAKILGIDLSPEAIVYAESALPKKAKEKVVFQKQNSKRLEYPDAHFDIVTAMLVCHHMKDDEFMIFLQESYRICSQAVLINDLQRHFLAYLSFSFLVPLFFPNRLIWYDGRLSIKRAFRKNELINLLEKAGFKKEQYVLKWNWAFRWTLLVNK